MNLNKMFVFIFVFLGVFAVLLVNMPGDFIRLGIEADVQDKEAIDFFSEHDVTVYNNTLSLNLTFTEEQQFDFGLPEGQKLEFWWNEMIHPYHRTFILKHLVDELLGYWYNQHSLDVQEPYASKVRWPDIGLGEDDLLALFDEEYNATYLEMACEHMSVKLFIVTYNQSWTLQESWDNGKLKMFTSYNIDWTATGTSMWHVMFQLLTYQSPDLGIPGVGGTILSHGVSLGLTASIVLLAFALVTSVIPFIRGWVGGGG